MRGSDCFSLRQLAKRDSYNKEKLNWEQEGETILRLRSCARMSRDIKDFQIWNQESNSWVGNKRSEKKVDKDTRNQGKKEKINFHLFRNIV